MNLILAAVVNAYDEAIDRRKQVRKEIALESLTKAFHLMDPNNTGRVDRDTIMGLFLILNEDYPEIRTLSHDETKLLFGFLDKDGSSTITLEEFQDFGSVLLLEFTKESGKCPWTNSLLAVASTVLNKDASIYRVRDICPKISPTHLRVQKIPTAVPRGSLYVL